MPPRRRIGWRQRALRAFGIACLALLLGLCGGFLFFVSSLDGYRHAGDPPRVQGIVALTGGSQRVADAIELLSRGFADRLLISGVNERTTRSQIARLNPGQKDWLECCVDLDHRARNTIGNAIETRRWVTDQGFEAIIVVTSNYHMPRTMLELDNAMPDVAKISACGFADGYGCGALVARCCHLPARGPGISQVSDGLGAHEAGE